MVRVGLVEVQNTRDILGRIFQNRVNENLKFDLTLDNNLNKHYSLVWVNSWKLFEQVLKVLNTKIQCRRSWVTLNR